MIDGIIVRDPVAVLPEGVGEYHLATGRLAALGKVVDGLSVVW